MGELPAGLDPLRMQVGGSISVCEHLRLEAAHFLKASGLSIRIDSLPCLSRCGTRMKGGEGGSAAGCFDLIAPPWLIQNLVREGAFLVCPGWLGDWERQVGAWGFEVEELKAFARESMKSVCLFDTFVLPRSEEMLASLAAALGLPAMRIPVGMEYCQAQLQRLVEGAAEKGSTIGKPGKDGPVSASRSNADFAMALDLLSQHFEFETEADVIQRVFSICSMLFAPRDQYLVRYAANIPVGVDRPSREEAAVDAAVASICTALSGAAGIIEFGEGLALPLDYHGARHGVLVVNGFAMTDQREEYRKILESIRPIFGLLLNNARSYETIRHNEIALRSKKEKLQRMLGSRDRLFSIIGHDLRGPVGTMRNLLRDLVERPGARTPGDQSRLLSEILRSSEHIYLLLINLLDWGKAQRSSIEPRSQPVKLKRIIEEICDLLGSEASAKDVKIIDMVDQDYILRVDPDALQTIVRNLLSNAIKFTPRGGKVSISTEVDNDSHRVRIVDTGVGMDLAEHAVASDQYLQRTSPGTNGEKGAGLGLALCREFAKKIGGELSIESEIGKGSSVSLVFRNTR